MTPKELAEKIRLFLYRNNHGNEDEVLSHLESLLTSALEEAKKSGFDLGIVDSLNQLKRNYEQGRKDAYEECIQIVEVVGEDEDEIIKRIRHRAKELK